MIFVGAPIISHQRRRFYAAKKKHAIIYFRLTIECRSAAVSYQNDTMLNFLNIIIRRI